MIISKKIVASACALLMTTSTATGVFAADNISKDADQQKNKPAQEMMQNQNDTSVSYAEAGSNSKLPPQPEMNGENRPADMLEMNGENRPADMPEMNGESRPEGMLEMNGGKLPAGPKEAEGVLNELGKSGISSDDSVKGLVDDYSNAVDSERNATDSDSRMSAAKLVKELADAINKALEKLGISARISAPADKPEMNSAASAQNSSAQ